MILASREFYTEEPYGESSRQVLARARSRAADLGVPHVVAVDGVGKEGGASLFMNFCHPTADGNRVIAAELKPVVERWTIAVR